jgi:hypothetical protein
MKKILNNKNLIDLNFSNNVDGALKFPYGNSATTFADEGWVRFNDITKKLEIFVSSAWENLATEDYVDDQIVAYISGAFDLSIYLLKEGGTVVSCLNFPNTGTIFNNAIRFGNPGTGISYNSVSDSFSFSIGNAEFFTLSSQGFIVGNKILDNKFFIDFTNNYVHLGSASPSFSIGNFNINSDSDIDLNLNAIDSNQFINFFSSSNSKFSIGLNFNNNKFVITSSNNVLETFFAIDSTGKIAVNSLINSTFTELFEVFGTAKFVDVVVSSKNKYSLPLSAGITGQVLRTTGPNGKLYWDNITVSSFGTGEQIAIGISANREIQFRTLIGGGVLNTTTVGNVIQLSAPRAVITTSSLGGVSMGLAVSAGTGNRNELLIRGLTGGGIVEVSALTNTIVISAAPFTQNITTSSFGGGNQIALGVSGNREIQFRTITGTGVLDATTVGNVIQLSAPRAVITTSSLGGVSLDLNVSAGTGNRNELLIRGLTGGGIVEVSALTNTIVISAAPFTQNITTSSFGGGNQIALGVSGNREIQFRTLVGGGIVDVISTPNTIVISAAPFTQNITTSSFGGGNQITLGVSGNREIQFRTLVGGGNVEVSATPNTIVISAASFIQNITTSSFGGGNQIALGVSGNREIQFRTLVGGGVVEVSATPNTIVISAASFIQNITTSSFGGGNQIAIGVSGNREIQFRTITGTGVLDATTIGNVIQLSAPKAEITTSSLGGVSLGLNVSAGTGNRNELLIRGLTGGGIVEVSALTNTIVISAAPFTQNITTSSFGTGEQIAIGVSGNREIQFRTLVGGGGIEVSATINTIIISATPGSFTQNITTSSFGTGAQITLGVSANQEIQFRTLVGGGGIEVSATTNTIILSANILEPVEYPGNFQLVASVNMVNHYYFYLSNGLQNYSQIDIVIFNLTPYRSTSVRLGFRVNGYLYHTSGTNNVYQIYYVNTAIVSATNSIVIASYTNGNTSQRREASISGEINVLNPAFYPGIVSARFAYNVWTKYRDNSNALQILEIRGGVRKDGGQDPRGPVEGLFIDCANSAFAGGIIKVYGRK